MFTSLSPKFHGAYLGAGTAAAISNVIVGLIQSYWTHAPLPAADVQLTYTLVGVILAGFGAWVMPSGKPVTQITLPPGSTQSSNVVVHGGGGGGGGNGGTVHPISGSGGGAVGSGGTVVSSGDSGLTP